MLFGCRERYAGLATLGMSENENDDHAIEESSDTYRWIHGLLSGFATPAGPCGTRAPTGNSPSCRGQVNSLKLKARKERRRKITMLGRSLLGSEVVTTRTLSRKQP